MQNEIWRSIQGLEVSSLGNVRGHQSLTYTREGYAMVRTNGQSTGLHRLICEAFNGPSPQGKPLCLHYDDDKANNCLENLRWGSHQDNADDLKRNNERRGVRHSNRAYLN